MANTSSAKKAERQAARRRVFNLRRKKAMHEAVKNTEKLIAGKSVKEASAMLPTLYQTVDKATKNGAILPNTAARIKSRMSKRVAALAK